MRFEPIIRISKGKDGDIFYHAGLMKIQDGQKPQYFFTGKYRDMDTALEYAIKDASNHNLNGVDHYKGDYDGYYAVETDEKITDPKEVAWMKNIEVLFKK